MSTPDVTSEPPNIFLKYFFLTFDIYFYHTMLFRERTVCTIFHGVSWILL
jgi:hypothetical protein